MNRGISTRFIHPDRTANGRYGYESAYEKVANEDLQDLGLQTRAAGKDLLQDADEEMAQRGGDEHAVQGHLGHAMAEIVAVLADIVGDPGREEFLQGREDTRGQHLGAQRVRLQLAQVKLDSFPGQQRHFRISQDKSGYEFTCWGESAYSKIPGLRLPPRQAITDFVRQLLGVMAHRVGGLFLELFLEFHRHGGW